MTRVGLFAIAAALAVLFGSGCGGGGGEKAAGLPSGPHPIILLDIGTLRADHLGVYGYARATSPNIDRLAAESVLFEWAFAQAPITGPSQASILTGLYPTSHGMTGEESRLSEEATTLAEVLSEQGYTTAAFVDGGYLSPGFGLEQSCVYDNSQEAASQSWDRGDAWLQQNASRNFSSIHTYDVHTPYAPPSRTGALPEACRADGRLRADRREDGGGARLVPDRDAEPSRKRTSVRRRSTTGDSLRGR
jgi:hypothetical protein